MEYFREYVEVEDPGEGHCVAEVRLCHDFPDIPRGEGNQVIVLDERVAALMGTPWGQSDMPTDTWSVLAT